MIVVELEHGYEEPQVLLLLADPSERVQPVSQVLKDLLYGVGVHI